MFRRSFSLVLTILLLTSCAPAALPKPTATKPEATLRVLLNTESKVLEPALTRFAQQEKINITPIEVGAVDLMGRLKQAQLDFDIALPASSLWLTLGDEGFNRVRSWESVMRSPIVFALKQSKARQLGFDNKTSVVDIVSAAVLNKLTYAMPDGSQSTPGAIWYFSNLYALSGKTSDFRQADLDNPQLATQIQDFLGKVDQSSANSDWLTDNLIANYNRLDAMVNYEAKVIDANNRLVKAGKEPLQVIYPADGLAVADFPLALVNPAKIELYDRLLRYLRQPDQQKEIFGQGWRTGLIGMEVPAEYQSVFQVSWGIRSGGAFTPIQLPTAPVIREALSLYQSAFRRGIIMVLLLDYSGSMAGARLAEMKKGVAAIVDPDSSQQYLLQISQRDVTIVIPFTDRVNNNEIMEVEGNDRAKLKELMAKVNAKGAGGGTNLYGAITKAMDVISARGPGDRLPSIVMLTDGRNESNSSFQNVEAYMTQSKINTAGGTKLPVYTIRFGDADPKELETISGRTQARCFGCEKGKALNLTEAFRAARGEN